jgi:hypothetical protein
MKKKNNKTIEADKDEAMGGGKAALVVGNTFTAVEGTVVAKKPKSWISCLFSSIKLVVAENCILRRR